MKTYFATNLHDSEEIARMHMPNSSRPVPVYLAADTKPDARGGRCACEWSGDALKVVCFAHLTAVREFDGTARAPAAEQKRELTASERTAVDKAFWASVQIVEPPSKPAAEREGVIEGLPTSHDIGIAAQSAGDRKHENGGIENQYSFRCGFREGANWMYDRAIALLQSKRTREGRC